MQVLLNDLPNLPATTGRSCSTCGGDAHTRRLGHEAEDFGADALTGTSASRRGERVVSDELAKELGMDSPRQ